MNRLIVGLAVLVSLLLFLGGAVMADGSDDNGSDSGNSDDDSSDDSLDDDSDDSLSDELEDEVEVAIGRMDIRKKPFLSSIVSNRLEKEALRVRAMNISEIEIEQEDELEDGELESDDWLKIKASGWDIGDLIKLKAKLGSNEWKGFLSMILSEGSPGLAAIRVKELKRMKISGNLEERAKLFRDFEDDPRQLIIERLKLAIKAAEENDTEYLDELKAILEKIEGLDVLSDADLEEANKLIYRMHARILLHHSKQMLEKAETLNERLLTIIGKMEDLLINFEDDVSAEARLGNHLKKLKEVQELFDEQITVTSDALESFKTDPSVENEKALRHEFHKLKAMASRIINGIKKWIRLHNYYNSVESPIESIAEVIGEGIPTQAEVVAEVNAIEPVPLLAEVELSSESISDPEANGGDA